MLAFSLVIKICFAFLTWMFLTQHVIETCVCALDLSIYIDALIDLDQKLWALQGHLVFCILHSVHIPNHI